MTREMKANLPLLIWAGAVLAFLIVVGVASIGVAI